MNLLYYRKHIIQFFSDIFQYLFLYSPLIIITISDGLFDYNTSNYNHTCSIRFHDFLLNTIICSYMLFSIGKKNLNRYMFMFSNKIIVQIYKIMFKRKPQNQPPTQRKKNVPPSAYQHSNEINFIRTFQIHIKIVHV